MAEEEPRVVCRTVWRCGNSFHTGVTGLRRQHLSQVQRAPPPGRGLQAQGTEYLRTHFIAPAADPYPAVDGEILHTTPPPHQFGDASAQNPTGRSPPSRMDQRYRATDRIDEIDRDTVRGGNREEDPRGGRGVAVDPLENHQPAQPIVPDYLGPMYLAGDDQTAAARHSGLESMPAPQNLTDRGRDPGQPQVEGDGAGAPAGDARDYPVPLPPLGQLEPGDRSGHRTFFHPSARSIPAPRATSRVSILS